MRRLFLLISILFLTAGLQAAEIALVYENEGMVAAGKFTVVSLVQEGALVPASYALKAGGNMLIGSLGGKLYTSAIVRLDNDLDLAVMRLSEPVTTPGLQEAHQKKSAAVMGFLPNSNTPGALGAPVATAGVAVSTSPVMLRLNGQDVIGQTFELKTGTLKKSKFKLEVVVVSTVPVWSFSLEVKSSPKLGFWKEGRQQALNDIPEPIFKYDHQALLVPLKDGKSYTVTVEAHFIEKDKPYLWNFLVRTKLGDFQQTATVIFHSK